MRHALLLSGTANLVLLAVLAVKHFGTAEPTARPDNPSPIKVIRKTRVATVTNDAPAITVTLPGDRFHWRQLESEDYFQYVGNLRGVGCPERTIQHIIIEDVEKLYREKALPEVNEESLWMTGSDRDARELDRKRRIIARSEEKAQLLKALLGKEVSREGRRTWVREEAAGWFLAFLSDEKAELVHTIGERLGNQMDAAMDRSSSVTGDARATAEGILQKMMEDLNRVASPGEVEEGLLRASIAVMFAMGNGPEELQLSGAELKRLAELQYKEQHPFSKVLDLMLDQDRPAVYSPEFIRDTRQILGEERFAKWLHATNRDLKHFGKDPNDPRSADRTVKAFDIQQAAIQEAEAIRARQDLTRAEKRAELRALQEMSKGALVEIADEKTAEAYLKSATWWGEMRHP